MARAVKRFRATLFRAISRKLGSAARLDIGAIPGDES
jgi:hypothetical protein